MAAGLSWQESDVCGYVAGADTPFASAGVVVAVQGAARHIVFGISYEDIAGFRVYCYAVGHGYIFFSAVGDEVVGDLFLGTYVDNAVGD